MIEGLFWEKFFIFCTKNEIYFMQIMSNGSKVLIKIADSLANYVLHRSKGAFDTNIIDDI